jgi:hypothetical protein
MGLVHGQAWASPTATRRSPVGTMQQSPVTASGVARKSTPPLTGVSPLALATPPAGPPAPQTPAPKRAASPPANPAAPATPARPAPSPVSAPKAPATPGAAPAAVSRPPSPPPRASKPTGAAKPEDKTAAAAQVKKARDLWYRGVDAFRAGNYEEARRAFAECYQLMPKSDVLRNLSISEIQSGHYVSAARHLKQLLAAPGDLPSNVREEANNRLAQAEAQIGQLNIGVDVPGAEITIDGTVIGRSPLEGNWYIEPGQHEVIVSKASYPVESRQVFALAGVAIPVHVSLETLRREQAADAKAAELMGTSEGQAIAMDSGSSIGTGSAVVLIAAGSLAAASLVAGIVFTVAANGHDSNAEDIAERLPGRGACQPGTLLPNDCAHMIREWEDSATDRNRATVSFIGFGVASAVTLGYALWLTLDDDDGAVSKSTTAVEPSISVGRGTASIHLHARF